MPTAPIIQSDTPVQPVQSASVAESAPIDIPVRPERDDRTSRISNVVWLSGDGEGLSIAWRLKRLGHDVTAWVKSQASPSQHQGLLEFADTLTAALDLVRPTTLVVFDSIGGGQTAARLYRQGIRVIGGSRFADRLGLDASFALRVMREAGIETPPSQTFDDFGEAIEVVRQSPIRRIFKPVQGDQAGIFACQPYESEELVAMLAFFDRQLTDDERPFRFIIQEAVEGIKIGIEGWFDGHQWLLPFSHYIHDDVSCCSWPVAGSGVNRLVEATLLKLTSLLSGRYVGPFHINCVVKSRPTGLSFVPSFNYHTIFSRLELNETPADAFLQGVTDGSIDRIAAAVDMISLSVRVTGHRDDFTQRLPAGLPILGLHVELLPHVWLRDIQLDQDGQPQTAGITPEILTVTASAPSLGQAAALSADRLRSIHIARASWRADIVDRAGRDIADLADWLAPVDVAQFPASLRLSQGSYTPSPQAGALSLADAAT